MRVIIRDGRRRSGYRPASCFTEAETNGRNHTTDIGGHGLLEGEATGRLEVPATAYDAQAETTAGLVGSLVLVMSNLSALLLWNGSVSRYETFVA